MTNYGLAALNSTLETQELESSFQARDLSASGRSAYRHSPGLAV